MISMLVGCSTFFLIGICVGIRAEYGNGYLDRHLRRPWPKPQPIVAQSHDDWIDDCERFNRAIITLPLDQRVLEAPDTLQ